LFWTGQKANLILTRGLNVQHAEAQRLGEHVGNGAAHHIQESFANHMPHILEAVILAGAYIRVT